MRRISVLCYSGSSYSDKMVYVVAFLYLALPVLSSATTGAVAARRLMYIGAIRVLYVGSGLGLVAIAANIGYGFLWATFYEWMYPTVVQMSKTHWVFYNYGNQQGQEIALMVGPAMIAGFFGAATWLTCLWWSKR